MTGSRIRRLDLESASPVAVVGSEQIQAQGIINTQDLLTKLPQVGIPGLSRTNSNFFTTGNGIATINLRNLGDSRTLVLVNGRRFVPGVAGTSIVDVNNIPADFVDRIEVADRRRLVRLWLRCHRRRRQLCPQDRHGGLRRPGAVGSDRRR